MFQPDNPMKTVLTILISAAAAAFGTWLLLKESAMAPASTGSAARKVLYYQSAMHPWIKSDHPGRCTICGMELTPVYEGDTGFDETGGENVVSLTQSQIQVLHVQTAKVEPRSLVRTLNVAGVIDDDATRHRMISAYVDGRIERLHVNYDGAEVREGQPLADIYSPTLLQAEREYRQLEGELKHKAGLRLLQMGLNPEQLADVDQKPETLLTSSILAPKGGTVVMRSVYEGQYVNTGQTLFEIADFSSMWFMFDAYEQDMPWIKKGLAVHVTTPATPDKIYQGNIVFIDPNFNEVTRSTKVRVELPNPEIEGRRELWHRLYADGMVELEVPDVLAIPRSAVIQTGRQALAYVDLGGGAYEQRRISLGRRGDIHVEVVSGLAEGERVVTNGNLLIDGQAEMNRAFMAAPEDSIQPDPSPEIDDEKQKAIKDFIKGADAMAAALANDDLAGFNQASEPMMNLTDAILTLPVLSGDKVEELDQFRHFHGYKDLKSARIAYHRFIVAAAAVMENLRHAGLSPAFEIYECGMVDEALPDVPAKARWIQISNRPLANPFFGREMRDCGKKIQP